MTRRLGLERRVYKLSSAKGPRAATRAGFFPRTFRGVSRFWGLMLTMVTVLNNALNTRDL